MGGTVAIYSADDKRPIIPGAHTIICVRGFKDLESAHNHALNKREEIAGREDFEKTRESADCIFFSSWWSDYQLTTHVSEKFHLRETQIKVEHVQEVESG